MSLVLLSEMLEPLPFTLREQIEGYAHSIDEVGEDILRDVGIPFDEQVMDQLVFIAGVRRLWTIVDGQFSILNNSLLLMAKDQVDGFSVGRRRLDHNSEDYKELAALRSDLLVILRKLNLERYVIVRSVRDIVVMLRRENVGPQ